MRGYELDLYFIIKLIGNKSSYVSHSDKLIAILSSLDLFYVSLLNFFSSLLYHSTYLFLLSWALTCVLVFGPFHPICPPSDFDFS